MELNNDLDLYMKVNQELCEGLIVKNYKELCKLLELPIGTGKQKKYQLEDLSRFFSYENQGQKFIITEIFVTPFEKVDRRMNPDNEILTTYIESLLLLDFLKRDTYSFDYTKKDLWHRLGMINNYYNNELNKEQTVTFDMLRYDYCKSKSKVGFINYNIEPWMLKNFYGRTRTIIDNKTKIALNRLQSRKLITWNEVLWKCSDDNKHYVVDNEQEQAQIMACERKIINEMVGRTKIVNGKRVATTIQDIIYNKKKDINYDSYKRKLDKELMKELGIKYVYKRYHIVCNTEYIEQGLEDNFKILLEYMNDKIITIVDADADKIQAKYTKSRYYAEFQKYLSQKLLRLDTVLQEDFFKHTLEEYQKEIDEMEELENLFAS